MGKNRNALDIKLGFQWKCNNFSNATENTHDIAFTEDASGTDVTVAGSQGMLGSATDDPAGNTFANNGCTLPSSQHFAVDIAAGTIQHFTYFYHTPEVSREFEPDCADPPIHTPIIWNQPTGIDFDDDPAFGSCVSALSQFQDDGDLLDLIVDAEAELEILEEVYADWSNGGNTQGLLDFIADPAHTSYEVRNELMLVAPSVDDSAWALTFVRTPTMNPWHLAQALIANSPLTQRTIMLMEQSGLDEYYRDLILGAQNGGISMQTIYRSEIAHFKALRERAVRDLTAKALRDGNNEALTNALQLHEEHPVTTSPQSMLAIDLALDDLAAARDLVDEQLSTSSQPEYWEVQDIHLSKLESQQDLADLDGNELQALQAIAGTRAYGAVHAQNWLRILGQVFDEVIQFPTHDRLLMQDVEHPAMNRSAVRLDVLPNPSAGPVAVAITLADGMEEAWLRIHDPQGRLLSEERVTGSVALVELNTQHLTSGVYVAELRSGALQLGRATFEIVR